MKKAIFYFVSITISVLVITSCGKDGAQGPTGPAGAAGAAGAVGPAGPAGTNGQNGSVIYSGTTAPASTVGVTGDFYIDLSTGLLYGPKAASGWGTGFSLKGTTGTTGATGAAGSKILSGTGTPAAALGANGDFYLDKTNFLLYGPKAAGAWGTGLNLRGAQGPTGNANVKTDTFTVSHTLWATGVVYPLEGFDGGINTIPYLSYQRANSTITADILDNGMVLAYFNPVVDYTTDTWEPLPFQFPILNNATQTPLYSYNFVYLPYEGGVSVGFYFQKIDPTTNVPNLATFLPDVNYKFKVVTVAGQAKVGLINNHVNLKDYKAVSKALGLWEQDKINH